MLVRNHNDICFSNYLNSKDKNVYFETSILRPHCALKGLSKYRKATDGFLTAEGLLAKVFLQVKIKRDFLTLFSLYDDRETRVRDDVYRSSTEIETPLILATAPNSCQCQSKHYNAHSKAISCLLSKV
jgi:hypothetical protein